MCNSKARAFDLSKILIMMRTFSVFTPQSSHDTQAPATAIAVFGSLFGSLGISVSSFSSILMNF